MGELYKKIEKFEEYQVRGAERNKTLMQAIIPKWFNFLGWLFMLGGLYYAYLKSNSVFVLVILIVSVFIFYSFLHSFLYSNIFYQYFLSRFRKNGKLTINYFMVDLIISSLILYLMYYFLEKIVKELIIT